MAPRKSGSKQHKRDPTRSQRRINTYERALTTLIKDYKTRVTRELEWGVTRALEVPSQKPFTIDLIWFGRKLDEIERETISEPAKKIIGDQIPQAYRAGVTWGSIQLGAPYEERVDTWKKIAALVKKNEYALKKISDEMGGRVRTIVADGIVREAKFGEITREIVREIDGIGITRATTMARTEIMVAVNQGVHDRYVAAGVEHERWLTALDERTCDICWNYDGKILPDSISTWPPIHPNCRCTTTPVIVLSSGRRV